MRIDLRLGSMFMVFIVSLLFVGSIGCDNSSSSNSSVNIGSPDTDPTSPTLPTCTDLNFNYAAIGTYVYNSSTGSLTVIINQTNLPLCCGPSETQWTTNATVGALTMIWDDNGNPMTLTRSSGTAGDIIGAWSLTEDKSGDKYAFIFKDDGTLSMCADCLSVSFGSELLIQGNICGTPINIDEDNACTVMDYNDLGGVESIDTKVEYNNQVFTIEIRSLQTLQPNTIFDVQADNIEIEIRERDSDSIIQTCHPDDGIDADTGTVSIGIYDNTRIQGSFDAIFNGEDLTGTFDISY